MKLYVIKNKEGEYLQRGLYCFSKHLENADIFYDYEMAQCECLSYCKVIEVTIAEGDLEKQLAEKDEKIKRYEKHDNYAYNISRLENLLKEKNKEVEKLQRMLKTHKKKSISISEKIKKWCNENKIDYYKESDNPHIVNWVIKIGELYKLLDKIESEERRNDDRSSIKHF